MQLKILAAAISPRQIIGPLDRVVEGIAYDSRRVQKNFLFVALRGEKTDGHQFIDQAVEKGASVIVTERDVVASEAHPKVHPRGCAHPEERHEGDRDGGFGRFTHVSPP